MALSVTDDALLQTIHLYSTQPGKEQLNLQLFGMPGHGKSSLINTCLHIVQRGAFMNVAGSGKSNYPITMERKEYELTPKVFITDNRGVSKMSPEEQDEMAAQMGQMRSNNMVKWDRSFREKLDLIHRQYSDRPKEITVPVFVYSAESLLTTERYAEIEPFIREAHKITDIYPIIVLTKVTSRTTMVADCHPLFKNFGAIKIFQVENYTVEKHEHNPQTQAEILRFLDTCLHEAEESVRRATKDPQIEYVRHAMDQVYHILEKEQEKHENKIREMEEKLEKNKEEQRQIVNIYKDKDKELQDLRKRRKSKCSVM
ncbi:uncharacterized protein ACNLHF_025257 [Anomaloglossus baeobatrachus]|uniref:uncharacterized protein LOC142246472 n=1 Tax=Anomaloglossus baeobatrachus TaxID=238106 RepID=UPI003F4F82FE